MIRLAELQIRLATHMGQASRRTDEDPLVYIVDIYGRRLPIKEVRLDFQPASLAEAEADVRHPVVELYGTEVGK